MGKQKYIYTAYDMKNRGKIVITGSAYAVAYRISCDPSVVYRCEERPHLVGARYKIRRKIYEDKNDSLRRK